jgi:hypothetical protein
MCVIYLCKVFDATICVVINSDLVIRIPSGESESHDLTVAADPGFDWVRARVRYGDCNGRGRDGSRDQERRKDDECEENALLHRKLRCQ